jgi:hypothetical protein
MREIWEPALPAALNLRGFPDALPAPAAPGRRRIRGIFASGISAPHGVHPNLVAVAARTVDLFEFVRVFLDRP